MHSARSSELARIDPEQTTGVLVKFNIVESYAPGIDRLQKGTVDVAYLEPDPGLHSCTTYLFLPWHCTPGETPPYRLTIDRDRASTSGPARRHARWSRQQAGGEEESEFVGWSYS